MNWNEIFEYRDGDLFWKINQHRTKAGDKVGTYYSNNHTYIFFKHNLIIARVIWEMHYGEIASNSVVVHLDKNTSNTKIENLCLAGQSTIFQHLPLRSTNSSGVTGVSFYAKLNKWIAEIRPNGKRYRSAHDTFDDAVLVRKKFEELYRDPSPYKEIS